jgi:hypothetical protein
MRIDMSSPAVSKVWESWLHDTDRTAFECLQREGVRSHRNPFPKHQPKHQATHEQKHQQKRSPLDLADQVAAGGINQADAAVLRP